MPDRAGQDGLGGGGGLIRVVANGELAFGFGRLGRAGGVLMLGDHIGAAIEQRFGGQALVLGVEPGVGPDDLDGGGRVGGAHAEGEGVDAADYFRNREGGDVAQVAAGAHLAGEPAGDVARLLDLAEGGADVVRRLVSRRYG